MFEWNEENPYVLNPLYFSNTTHITYNQTMMAFLHKWNTTLASLLGVSSCFLIVFLVLKKTPRHFRGYSRIILFGTSVDIYFLAVESLAQFRFRVSGGALMFSVNGPLSILPYWWQCKLISLYSAAFASAYLMLPFQYAYRFLIIKHKQPPSFLRISILLFFGVIIVVLSLFSAHYGYCSNNNADHKEYANLWYAEVPVPQIIYGLNTDPLMYVHAGGFTVLGIFCYTSAIVLARQTVYILRRQAFQMSRKTYSLQKQFGRALFAQALAPLCCAIFPVILAIMSAHFQIELGYANQFIILSIEYFPFFNSVTNIVFISPYRNFCLQPFKRIRTLVATQSISVVASNYN